MIPGDVVETAVAQCDKTLNEKCDLNQEAIKKMLEKFSAFGVTKEMFEGRIPAKKSDAITTGQFVGLRKVYNSLKDGMSSPSEWFPVAEAKPGTQAVKKNASY